MSATMVLPRIWATAVGIAAVPERRFGPVSAGCERTYAGSGETSGARLRLVSAHAESVVTKPQAMAVLRPELAFYRKYTEALLRRYMRLSFEVGRTPSLLGRELFRGNVTHCKVRGFDDVVIFVHDVENCLAKLGKGQQDLIRRVALQEYSQGEAAELLGVSLRSVLRGYADALDRLTALFLEREMLEPLSACQGGEPAS